MKSVAVTRVVLFPQFGACCMVLLFISEVRVSWGRSQGRISIADR